jgi:hypothetical protein
MAPGTALLARPALLRTGTTAQCAMPFRKLRQIARLVLPEVTVLGLVARFVRRFARLVTMIYVERRDLLLIGSL